MPGALLMELDRSAWASELASEEERLQLNEGFKLLFCPWRTLGTASVAFVSLNPGRAPDGEDVRVVSDERGNSYLVEKDYTVSPITEQFLALCRFIRVSPSQVLTGVAHPFRSSNWNELTQIQKEAGLAIGQRFWAVALRSNALKLVIVVSNEAARVAQTALMARYVSTSESGWGTTKIEIWEGHGGARVVKLPHLSRFKLFSRRECEPFLRRALG
jgi:hypothetical protein